MLNVAEVAAVVCCPECVTCGVGREGGVGCAKVALLCGVLGVLGGFLLDGMFVELRVLSFAMSKWAGFNESSEKVFR